MQSGPMSFPEVTIAEHNSRKAMGQAVSNSLSLNAEKGNHRFGLHH